MGEREQQKSDEIAIAVKLPGRQYLVLGIWYLEDQRIGGAGQTVHSSQSEDPLVSPGV